MQLLLPLVMSAVSAWMSPPQLSWPATPLRSAVADASPVVTSVDAERLRASIDVAPAETAPMTCPATPSPVEALEVCVLVTRLSPSWALHVKTPMRSVVIAWSAPPQLNCPANVAACVDAPASPVWTLTSVEALSATMLAEPPAEVTAPMTWPPTPSPVFALELCVLVVRLLPS